MKVGTLEGIQGYLTPLHAEGNGAGQTRETLPCAQSNRRGAIPCRFTRLASSLTDEASGGRLAGGKLKPVGPGRGSNYPSSPISLPPQATDGNKAEGNLASSVFGIGIWIVECAGQARSETEQSEISREGAKLAKEKEGVIDTAQNASNKTPRSLIRRKQIGKQVHDF